MPPRDKAYHRRIQRNYVRKKHHGDWRAIIDYWCGLCAECGKRFEGDLHEPFGEDKALLGKFQQRLPLCIDCHRWRHNGRMTNVNGSMYMDDIDAEIRECGSYEAWKKKYKVGVIIVFGEEMQLEDMGRTELQG